MVVLDLELALSEERMPAKWSYLNKGRKLKIICLVLVIFVTELH